MENVDPKEQLELIKKVVVDSDGSYPLNHKDFVTYGLVSMVLFGVMRCF